MAGYFNLYLHAWLPLTWKCFCGLILGTEFSDIVNTWYCFSNTSIMGTVLVDLREMVARHLGRAGTIHWHSGTVFGFKIVCLSGNCRQKKISSFGIQRPYTGRTYWDPHSVVPDMGCRTLSRNRNYEKSTSPHCLHILFLKTCWYIVRQGNVFVFPEWYLRLAQDLVGVIWRDTAVCCYLDISRLWTVGPCRSYTRLSKECWDRETEIMYRTKTSSKSKF